MARASFLKHKIQIKRELKVAYEKQTMILFITIQCDDIQFNAETPYITMQYNTIPHTTQSKTIRSNTKNEYGKTQ